MNNQPLLTIFTPAYNRAYCLHLCYESLQRQTSKDFTWLIIDDGSTDNTKELVDQWIKENQVPLRYVYKENGGMHTVHNLAYQLIETELNTCIDSDDYMPDNAVEKIIQYWQSQGGGDYAGLIGLDHDVHGHLIGQPFNPESKIFYRGVPGFIGDKKFVLRTDLAKQENPYPVFPGEKYYGLGNLYDRISYKYPFLLINEPLCIVEYQADGSTNNMYRQYVNNPQGFAHMKQAAMCAQHSSRRAKIKACIHYIADSLLAKNSRLLLDSPRKLMTLALFPMGLLFYCFIRYKTK